MAEGPQLTIEHDTAEREAAIYASSIPLPENYDRIGMYHTHNGPRLLVAGSDVPPMFYTGHGWVALFAPEGRQL